MSEKYNTYLKSDWWIQFSTKIKLDTRACERCGVIYKLQVHHVTYKRL